MWKSITNIIAITLIVLSGAAFAEACTYHEAMLALQQGNAQRGMALMRMASNDGDARATEYLAAVAWPSAQEPKPQPLASTDASIARR